MTFAKFATHNAAVPFVQVARQYGLVQPRQLHMKLSEVLQAHLELPGFKSVHKLDYTQASQTGSSLQRLCVI